MPPVDWSEHRLPMTYVPGRLGRAWRLLPIIVVVVALLYAGVSYVTAAVVGSALLATLAAFLFERRYRTRPTSLRFGRAGTAVMLSSIWLLVFGVELFLFLIYSPSAKGS